MTATEVTVQQTDDAPSLYAAMYNTLGYFVDAVEQCDVLANVVAAQRAELVEQARQWSVVMESLIVGNPHQGWNPEVRARQTLTSELASALRLPERTVESLIENSRTLLSELPATLAALKDGSISYPHVQKILDNAYSLPVESRAAFEEAVLESAKTLTVARFNQKARITREKMHPDSIALRAAKSAADRRVAIDPAADGMAWLSAYLPAEQAMAIYNRVTDIATGLNTRDEERTLGQLRADVLSELLIDGETDAGTGRGVKAEVMVTVPVLTLIGTTEEPGSLEGYGPIPADTARRLAAGAPSFMRLLTHPESGAVLSVGRDRYKVPKDLRMWLRVRDGTCRFPGCGLAAVRCDMDHTVAWQHGGGTNHDNLVHLCAKHHRLKHHTEWTVRHLRHGIIEWRSPSGRTYVTKPATDMSGGAPPTL